MNTCCVGWFIEEKITRIAAPSICRTRIQREVRTKIFGETGVYVFVDHGDSFKHGTVFNREPVKGFKDRSNM